MRNSQHPSWVRTSAFNLEKCTPSPKCYINFLYKVEASTCGGWSQVCQPPCECSSGISNQRVYSGAGPSPPGEVRLHPGRCVYLGQRRPQAGRLAYTEAGAYPRGQVLPLLALHSVPGVLCGGQFKATSFRQMRASRGWMQPPGRWKAPRPHRTSRQLSRPRRPRWCRLRRAVAMCPEPREQLARGQRDWESARREPSAQERRFSSHTKVSV